MAAASTHIFLACLYCFFVVLCIDVPSSLSVSFSFDFSNTTTTDPCGHEIVCHDDASFFPPAIELTKNTQTSPTSFSKGRVWYAKPVPLWDVATGEVATFTTAFSFNITPTNFPIPACEHWQSTTGDGMAFFLAPYSSGGSNTVVLANASSGGDLDLYKTSSHFNATGDERAVAVEFDTFVNNVWDSGEQQHVGIDVNSIRSVEYSNVTPSSMNLTSPYTKVATVRYDNATKLLAVDLGIGDAVYRVSATVDFKTSLPDTVAVGFSAATGDCVEAHQLLSWSFSSTLVAPPPLPAPAPAPSVLVPTTPGAPQPRLSTAPAIKPEPSTTTVKVLVPVVASVVLVCAAAVAFLLWLLRRKRKHARHDDDSSECDDEQGRGEADDLERGVAAGPRRYLYRELAAATGDFAEENMLGRGGFGSVYQGRLPIISSDDGQQQQLVAIKKFSSESSQSRKEFEAEVKIISRLRHRNLVQLLGWCDSRRGLLLVYELVPQGSLDRHIHSTERVLTWSERYNIILGLGSALHYLHRDWDQRVVHGDIKPSNIMLDSSYSTKLGDFGLARLGDHGAGPQTTDLVKGTKGYIDPEFVNTHRRSTESDICSFGIVLLELVSGRPPVTRLDPSFTLLGWVESLWRQGAILDAADARLLRRGDDDDDNDGERRQMERALLVGIWCAQRHPAERPSIAEAMQALQSNDHCKLPLLSPQMTSTSDSGVSAGSRSFSSGGVRRSTANTDKTDSSGSSLANLPVLLPHSTP